MALQELQHRYICGYKEFFVTWDKEEAAMFVCIVMEFYKNGDLERVLKQRRQTQQPIEELVSQHIILVFGVIYIHIYIYMYYMQNDVISSIVSHGFCLL